MTNAIQINFKAGEVPMTLFVDGQSYAPIRIIGPKMDLNYVFTIMEVYRIITIEDRMPKFNINNPCPMIDRILKYCKLDTGNLAIRQAICELNDADIAECKSKDDLLKLLEKEWS